MPACSAYLVSESCFLAFACFIGLDCNPLLVVCLPLSSFAQDSLLFVCLGGCWPWLRPADLALSRLGRRLTVYLRPQWCLASVPSGSGQAAHQAFCTHAWWCLCVHGQVGWQWPRHLCLLSLDCFKASHCLPGNKLPSGPPVTQSTRSALETFLKVSKIVQQI